ncbi:hypothetical protein [Mammaliicoccus lentus]|uniref:hypothetical protein n=1 Tax=Mammaliicoccus lentus TaxID=42858 RepID=UPI0024A84869|nr:hypothetical protein [Mammaliicoccus lentus]WHI55193.1 hypothetical protein PYH59_02320 [Mammaliicoccus lentus]WHI57715.1 hypothetical protein PYH49_02320 [Mammaliicoccus lentus]WHI65562.1 hypothetical protein PYH50_02330 [Mammaliicoccus lentus]WHI86452.1 hypothetical protein PYH60_02325 [Mammaliicoccus lentus]WHI90962.1 hypothetical protein PYH61_02315 [Mammaliicoccus lentus]
MFEFHLDYWRNGRGLHLKTVLLSILTSIVLGIIMLVPGVIFLIGAISMISSQDFYGEPSGGGIVAFLISMVIGFIVSLLLYVFVLIPMTYGFLKYYKDTDLGRAPRFSDLLLFFKKGKYVKTLKLTAIMFVISVALAIVLYIVVFIVELIFIAIFGTSAAFINENNFGAMSVSFLIIMLLMMLIIFALYIPIYYVVIFLVNTVLVHIDQQSLPTLNKLSIGWNITSKGPKSAWKLLFSNVLYFIVAYIILAIIAVITALIISLLPDVLKILLGIFAYIFAFVYLIAMSYIMYGSAMNFYHKNKNALYPQNDQPDE